MTTTTITHQPSSTSRTTQYSAESVDEDQEEDYIIDMEMEVVSSSNSSSSKCLCNYNSLSSSPPHNNREFEFHSALAHDREAITSPADELFYKGKLLPLHLPPRLQMVQKLLQTTKIQEPFEESYANITSTSTPMESCNISPAESCRVSSELNPDEYFFEWCSDLNGFIAEHPRNKHSWYKKLKQIKQSQLGQKIKASRAYLKSLFSKSGGCSDESCGKAACKGEAENVSRYVKVVKRNPFGLIDNDRYRISTTALKSIDHKEIMGEDGVNIQRRSFSGAIKWHSSAAKCSSSSTTSTSSSSSSSFSFSSSNGYYDLQFLKRSSSANSELESSIEGAIAHCKQSSSCLVQERLQVK